MIAQLSENYRRVLFSADFIMEIITLHEFPIKMSPWRDLAIELSIFRPLLEGGGFLSLYMFLEFLEFSGFSVSAHF